MIVPLADVSSSIDTKTGVAFFLFGSKTIDISFFQKAVSIQAREIYFSGQSENYVGEAQVSYRYIFSIGLL